MTRAGQLLVLVSLGLFFPVWVDAADMRGLWAERCEGNDNGLVLSIGYPDNSDNPSGGYRLARCYRFKCIPVPEYREPTPIVGDKRFREVSGNAFVMEFEGSSITMHKCHETTR